MEGLNPLMPILTMVKTCMPRRISAGLLASGTLSRANFSNKYILNDAAAALVFFNGTTDDDDVCFICHSIASFQHAASLLAYRCIRNPRYQVNEDEHYQLLSGEGILYNKVPRKRKKCNKTNYEGIGSPSFRLMCRGAFIAPTNGKSFPRRAQ